MRLGLSSYTYTWAVGVPGDAPARPMTAIDLVRRAAALGVRLVQIADNLPLDRLPEAELRDLEAEAIRLEVAIEVGTRGIAPDHARRESGLSDPVARLPGNTDRDRRAACRADGDRPGDQHRHCAQRAGNRDGRRRTGCAAVRMLRGCHPSPGRAHRELMILLTEASLSQRREERKGKGRAGKHPEEGILGDPCVSARDGLLRS